MVKERTKKIFYILLACCMILSVICISGAVKYNADRKIAKVLCDEARFEADSLSFLDDEFEKENAISYCEYRSREHNRILSITNAYAVGIAVFLTVAAVTAILFYLKIYLKMNDTEKHSFKRTIIKIGLVCAVIALIAFVVLTFYSVDKLEYYEERLYLSEEMDEIFGNDYYYDIKEYKAYCNKYELFTAISVIGSCVSVIALLAFIIVLSIRKTQERNISIRSIMPKSKQGSEVYNKLTELKKLAEEGIITQEEFDTKKEKILEEL